MIDARHKTSLGCLIAHQFQFRPFLRRDKNASMTQSGFCCQRVSCYLWENLASLHINNLKQGLVSDYREARRSGMINASWGCRDNYLKRSFSTMCCLKLTTNKIWLQAASLFSEIFRGDTSCFESRKLKCSKVIKKKWRNFKKLFMGASKFCVLENILFGSFDFSEWTKLKFWNHIKYLSCESYV